MASTSSLSALLIVCGTSTKARFESLVVPKVRAHQALPELAVVWDGENGEGRADVVADFPIEIKQLGAELKAASRT